MDTFDLIIIGGGPAGITAGIYGARKKLKILLITKDFVGQAGKAFSIENFPGFERIHGLELIEKLKNQLKRFEITIVEGENAKEIKKNKNLFRISVNKKDKYFSKTIIITSGRDPRPLEVPGEKEFLGKGVSYCVHCDAPLFKDKITAVVGGGNAALGSALDLARYCPKVYLLEAGLKSVADELIQERVKKNKKIEIIYNAKVKEIKGQKFVKLLVYQDQISKKDIELPVEGVFIEIGSVPATGFIRGLVDFNEKDEIKINLKTCATKTPGLFAAGDVSEIKYKQIIIAAGEGAKAALSAYEYISKNE